MVGTSAILGLFGAALPLGVFVVVFVESAVLPGIVLSGDSVLIVSGLWAAGAGRDHTHPDVIWLLVCAIVGSVAGAQVGFLTGRAARRRLVDRPGARLAAWSGLRPAEQAFTRYGMARAVVLGRFVPGVRTLVSPAAAFMGMEGGAFFGWQAVGGVAWSVTLILSTYFAGESIHNLDHYLVPAVLLLAAASLVSCVLDARRAQVAPGSTIGRR